MFAPQSAKRLTDKFAVTGQLGAEDFTAVYAAGYRTIICNRPDGEESGQPSSATLSKAASELGLNFVYLPVSSRDISPANARAMQNTLKRAQGPVLAFCRSGARSEAMFEAARQLPETSTPVYDVVIIGGGSGGLSCAASLLKRNSRISIAVVDPATNHYYQPGWTMVGAGVFNPEVTCRQMADVMPRGVDWIQQAVVSFDPARNNIYLADGDKLQYRTLVVAPGIRLDWDAIPGLSKALGRNGVTSNYRYDLAPYTCDLVRGTPPKRALFTQPPMPIKCAGAPQKAMYLSCHHWEETGALKDIEVEFHTAGPALFGVADYVPALQDYIARYDIRFRPGSKLVAVDGDSKTAVFETTTVQGLSQYERKFGMLHAVPPQVAPDFIRNSPLADPSGFLSVDPTTLRHTQWANIFGLGDVLNTTNAKTAAAARKQAPVVAVNVLAALDSQPPKAGYDGYGSCPLTVERGRIVLAEFGYGGKLLPSFPKWLLDGRKPTRLAWFLKDRLLPPIYWHGMLKGHEWMVAPQALEK